MFTGIVQSQAEIISADVNHGLMRLVIKGNLALINHLQLGASIAVNGCCLTVVEFSQQQHNSVIHFDVIEETLKLTNLGCLSIADNVNVERSLKVGDELGGHIVSGHIHTTASLTHIEQTETNCSMTFKLSEQWKKFVLAKGFITVNGISLTVGDVLNDHFTVHLIPETLSRTNLSSLSIGALVNIECDQQTITIVNTIERMKL
ncbi:riboflavin synthase subunit alpha [Thalassotalea sp. 1_MG-2023]|uniref:riboflavin synthase subunit alpha n=1 Tax=Thalassotalea sp. 1_MG-2023 TaxID=3062680 RepID=UPI0026E2DD89|nr:riboflavin synthase subunit alpha [Thalassotalea sp. 1_MG-2023]MDO6426868.1 riboflavin synthase subunit alpha [Thalassotalea sp. 1_MG-2023]